MENWDPAIVVGEPIIQEVSQDRRRECFAARGYIVYIDWRSRKGILLRTLAPLAYCIARVGWSWRRAWCDWFPAQSWIDVVLEAEIQICHSVKRMDIRQNWALRFEISNISLENFCASVSAAKHSKRLNLVPKRLSNSDT